MSEHNSSNGQRTKNFSLEEIPAETHKYWKMLAATMDLSMREFCIKALQEKIERELKSQL